MWTREINELYLMECEGYVKIGIAQNSESRRRLLQTGNPFEIKLIQALPCANPQEEESKFHKKYAQYRVRGEWFKLPKEILNELIFETHPNVRYDPPVPYDYSRPPKEDQEPDPEYWSHL